MEAIQQFEPNIVGFQMATGEQRWYIIGCYLALEDTSTIEIVITVLKKRPRGLELLVVGDLNAKPGRDRERSEGGGYSGGTDGGRFRRHFGPLPPMMAPMVPGRENVEHGLVGEVGTVLDRLHSGYRLSSLQ